MVEQKKTQMKVARFGKKRKRACSFCVDKVTEIDYKDVNMLRNYVSLRGKIVAKRQSAVCPKHQRELAMAVKRSRTIGLLPFVVE